MKKKLLSMFLAATMIAGILTGCGSSSTKEKEQATSIRIAVNGFYSLINGYEEKYHWLEEEFSKDGIELEFVRFEYGPPIVESIAADGIDITTELGDTPLITSYANGTGIQAVYVTIKNPDSVSIVTNAGSGIETIEDLKGKKIGFQVGSVMHDFILRQLAAAGLSEEDVELINISSANDQLAALQTNEVDAIVQMDPITASFLQNGAVRVDYGESQKINVQNISVRTKFAEENPELVARYLKVVDKIYQYAIDHPEETAEVYAEMTGYDVNSIDFVENMHMQGSFDDWCVESLNGSVEFLVNNGTLSDTVDLSNAYTNKYYEEAKRLEAEENE